MSEDFFTRPIINSPFEPPRQHWELDPDGQPTNVLAATRRKSDLITPVPKPQKRRRSKGKDDQAEMVLGGGDDLSTADQEYNPTWIINEIRGHVEAWRQLPNPDQWQVTPETARLLQHWRHHPFENIRPFFCQVEALEIAIWLAEVTAWIRWRLDEGVLPAEVGVFVRAEPQLGRTRAAIEHAGQTACLLSDSVETAAGCIAAGDRRWLP